VLSVDIANTTHLDRKAQSVKRLPLALLLVWHRPLGVRSLLSLQSGRFSAMYIAPFWKRFLSPEGKYLEDSLFGSDMYI